MKGFFCAQLQPQEKGKEKMGKKSRTTEDLPQQTDYMEKSYLKLKSKMTNYLIGKFKLLSIAM